MAADVSEANVNTVFDIFDADGNGVIEASDFQAQADKMCATVAPDSSSRHHQAIHKAYAAWSEQVLKATDADPDGRVTRQEFLNAVRAGALKDGPDQLDGPMGVTRATFEALDTDGDGQLSPDEFVRMHQALGRDTGKARAAFEQIDTDGDGRITWQELRKAAQGLYTDGQAEQTGKLLLG